MRRFLYLVTKKCRIYAACGVSQTPIKPILERSKVEEVRTLMHLMIEEITIDRKTRSVDTISIKFNRQLTDYLCLHEGASKEASFFSALKGEELAFVIRL